MNKQQKTAVNMAKFIQDQGSDAQWNENSR
ncbi:Rop family plasmid primer RNA-binding protein [Salmonella enterica]|nr:Rop family plasmid primer RNA-binding protein [Salmonella enterica]EGK1328081.1 Rop family plasmid primer RNA-binding protein [Salmonella enterica]